MQAKAQLTKKQFFMLEQMGHGPQELAGEGLADALGAASDDDTQRSRGRPPEAHHPVAVQGCREIEMGGDTKFNGSRASAC